MQLSLFDNEEKSVEAENCNYRKCKVCKEKLPLTNEYFHFAARGGVGYTQHLKGICRECDDKHRNIRTHLRQKHMKDYPENCTCCGRHVSETKRGFQCDHCYVTGSFRGWICEQCNKGIGNLGETVEGLEKALAYLKRHYDGQP
jgi:hypothetical protein